ncbi:MAG: hypothetical protein CM15mV132_340 [uncultured marine virus]|nr:MAG: hypothetical protein CM15mV132_340 [uncultured marine virus]
MIIKKISKKDLMDSCIINVKKIIFMGLFLFAVPILKSFLSKWISNICCLFPNPP